jgi:chromosome segregation ATPase
VASDTLAQLVARHEEARAAFAREMVEAQASFEADQKRLAEALADEKARARKAWEREQEEREYTTRTRRRRDEEEHKARRQAELTALAEEKAKSEQTLAAREAAITAAEAELADLRSRVGAFPAELDWAVAQAREEAVGEVEARAGHEAEPRAKDAEATEGLLKLRIQTLDQLVKQQTGRIEELQGELRAATEKVQAVAVKVIEGASGAAALTRVSEIALQHAKTRSEGQALLREAGRGPR